MPSVKYLVIASDDRILLDAANKKFDSKYSATVSKLLAKVQTQQKDKHMINMQNHTFAFRLIHDLWYVCVSDAGFGKQMPFIFLQGTLSLSISHCALSPRRFMWPCFFSAFSNLTLLDLSPLLRSVDVADNFVKKYPDLSKVGICVLLVL